jgi:hypothetical protein
MVRIQIAIPRVLNLEVLRWTTLQTVHERTAIGES